MKYETRSIATIEALLGVINEYLPLTQDASRKLAKKMRLEFNYNSNHLEGNTLTFGQTELLLFSDKIVGNAKASDVEEMKGHDIALKAVEEMAADTDRPLTETFIKELNRLVLVRPFWKEAITPEGIATKKKIEVGAYKSMPNSVRLKTGEIHDYASPEETPAEMHSLMNWYRSQEGVMHPVQLAIEFHYRFVCIHPFDDGNGRVSRLLMNYILLKYDYPPIVIKSADKDNYLTALQQADAGDLVAMLEYHEQQLIWSLNLKLKAAKGESIEEESDLDKEIELLKREKLTTTKIHKTPKVLYELIAYVNDQVWKDISVGLNRFDDFFVEIKNQVLVDGRKVEKRILKKNMFTMMQDRYEVVKPYFIFEVDLEKDKIAKIVWKSEMLSLKSAERKSDYCIELRLSLNESTYDVEIGGKVLKSGHENAETLLKLVRDYNNYLLKSETKELVAQLSSYLIESIKAQD